MGQLDSFRDMAVPLQHRQLSPVQVLGELPHATRRCLDGPLPPPPARPATVAVRSAGRRRAEVAPRALSFLRHPAPRHEGQTLGCVDRQGTVPAPERPARLLLKRDLLDTALSPSLLLPSSSSDADSYVTQFEPMTIRSRPHTEQVLKLL